MGWRRRVLLGFGITCVALFGLGLWLHQRLDSSLPREPDLGFLDQRADRFFKHIQESEAYFAGKPGPTTLHTPELVYQFSLPQKEVEQLLRDELKGKDGWIIKETVPSKSYFWVTNYKLPRQVVVEVRGSNDSTQVTVSNAGWVSPLEARLLHQIWVWEGTDIKAGT
jgi:hypothetical protein